GAFPPTVWLDDDPPPVDADAWRLVVDGDVEGPLRLSCADLAARRSASLEATLDCTGGWYTTQRWTGVPLAALLDEARPRDTARSVSVESTTGYARRFSL